MVVVQDGQGVAVGDGGDEEVDGRQAVVPDPGELALRVDGTALDVVVDAGEREREQLVEEPVVILGVARRVAGLEQERQVATLLERNVAYENIRVVTSEAGEGRVVMAVAKG